MVRAFRRSLMGRSTVSPQSRFLDDIPQHLISSSGQWQGEDSQVTPSIYSWNKAPDTSPTLPTPELKAGDHVRHAQFGEGVVVSYQKVKDDAEVVVAFNGAVKKLLLSFAQMEKVE